MKKEKIYAFDLDHALNAKRRSLLDSLISQNRHLSPVPATAEWETNQLLLVHTPPVEWEFVFTRDRLEVFGAAPFWARALFTKAKRAQLEEVFHRCLVHAGLVEKG